MNKKNLILVVIILVAFAASGFVLYNGLFKGSTAVVPVSTAPVVLEKVLPYGDTFNYQFMDQLKDRNFRFGAVTYPVLDPATEVGKDSLSAMVPPPLPTPNPTRK